MITPYPQRFVFGLIALLAMGWAQTFGLHRGFMCDCSGVELMTQVDHCHGPHSSACHDDEDHSVPHDHDDEDESTHEHASVVDSLLAQFQQDTGAAISAPVKVLGTLDLLERVRFSSVQGKCTPEIPPRPWRQMQDWPRRLAQTIALRI